MYFTLDYDFKHSRMKYYKKGWMVFAAGLLLPLHQHHGNKTRFIAFDSGRITSLAKYQARP